jgi:hypothetical protein
MRLKYGNQIVDKHLSLSDSDDDGWSQDKTAEMQNQCAEIKIRAERKAGGILIDQIDHKGGQPYYHGTPITKDFDIDRKQSNRWQYIASIPEETFEKEIADTIKAKEDLMKLVVKE